MIINWILESVKGEELVIINWILQSVTGGTFCVKILISHIIEEKS